MSTPAPVIVVFSDQHSNDVLTAFSTQQPQVPLYVVHRDGAVHTVRGMPATTLPGLNALHVVWVGVPARWAANKVGSDSLFHSHHVGNKVRFSRVPELVLVHRAVAQAHELLKLKAQQEKVEHTEHVETQKEAHRQHVLGAPPPWFIPEMLR